MRVPRTFVFVDLSGFTNYTAAFGDDAAGRLLSAFRTIVREVASDRGVRIAKWLGDGCMIVAVDQTDAIAFTLDLEDRVGRGVLAADPARRPRHRATPCCSRATTTSARPSTWPPGCATSPSAYEVLIPTMGLERLPEGVVGHAPRPGRAGRLPRRRSRCSS